MDTTNGIDFAAKGYGSMSDYLRNSNTPDALALSAPNPVQVNPYTINSNPNLNSVAANNWKPIANMEVPVYRPVTMNNSQSSLVSPGMPYSKYSSGSNVNFNLSPTSTIPSSYLSSSNSLGSILDTRNKLEGDMMSGSNTGLVPSNNMQAQLAGQIYNSSLYSPEEQSTLQNLSDLNSRIAATNIANRRQIKDLQENGSITKEQASAFVSESQRRSDAQMADLAVSQQAATNQLGVYGSIRQNQLGAYQNLASLLKPVEVSPGSTLYSPIGGVQYQGTGASPTAIASLAQQMASSDQSQGTLLTNSDGSINYESYYQRATQLLSGGMGGGQMTASNGAPNQLQQVAQMLVDGTLSPSNIPQGLNQTAVLNAANQISMQTKGQPFNSNQSQANYEATKAALQQNATTYRTLANAQSTAVSHLDDLLTYYNELGGYSKGFPVTNSIVNQIKSLYGDRALQSYQTTLQTARGEIAKVLAGGGAPSDAENKAAAAVLPDNMSPAQIQGAIASAKLLMQQKITEYSNTSNVPQYGQKTPSSTGSSIYDF